MKMKAFCIALILFSLSLQETAVEDGRTFNFLTDDSSMTSSLDGPDSSEKPMSLDASLFEAHAGEAFDQTKPVSVDNNNLRADEDFVRNSIPELKQRDFDIERFLEEFDRIDCSRNNGDDKDPLNVLCESQLMNEAFAPLGQSSTDNNSFYGYLKDQIYQPLAYDIRKRESLSDMLLDTFNMNAKSSLFYNRPLMTNYNKFEETILNFFDDIAGKSSDMEANKDAINEKIISILKRFHLYWNFLRYKGQFEKLKVDTKEVMRTVLKSYMMKRDFLNYVSKTLIKGIIKAYYRFVRAHKMVEVLNKFGPQLIVTQILNRYKEVGQRIKNSNFSQVLLVKESSYLISLLQVFHILSYKQGLQDSTITTNFGTMIMHRLQTEYDFFEQYLTDEPQDKTRLKQIRDFTAMLLLKFKHMTFIMFNYHGISQYANMPQMNYLKAPFAIKIYYELLDNMLIVPKTCANYLLLKNCVVHETTKVLRYLSNKYMVKRSTYGWYFLQELSSMMKSLYSKADANTWSNWGLFKEYFYQNLFSVMYTYKKMFQVNDMDAVENLENLIGSKIDTFKNDNIISKDPMDFGLVDQLDKSIYNEFLNIKSDYNNYSPVQRDPTVKTFLRNRLNKFLDIFEKDNQTRLTGPFKDTLKKIKEGVDVWMTESARELEKSFNVGPMSLVPMVENLSTEGGQPYDERLQVPSNDDLLKQSEGALISMDLPNKSNNLPKLSVELPQISQLKESAVAPKLSQSAKTVESPPNEAKLATENSPVHEAFSETKAVSGVAEEENSKK